VRSLAAVADRRQLAAEVAAVPEMVAQQQRLPQQLRPGGAEGLQRLTGGARRPGTHHRPVRLQRRRAVHGLARLLDLAPGGDGQAPQVIHGGNTRRPLRIALTPERHRAACVVIHQLELGELHCSDTLRGPPLRLFKLVLQRQQLRRGIVGESRPHHRLAD